MVESTPCPRCCSLRTQAKHLVERCYLHPLMALILGLLTATFFGFNSSNLLAASLIGVGITALFILAPVTRRIIGVRHACSRCGHQWTISPGTLARRLRIVP
jgi:hypothetical protein